MTKQTLKKILKQTDNKLYRKIIAMLLYYWNDYKNDIADWSCFNGDFDELTFNDDLIKFYDDFKNEIEQELDFNDEVKKQIANYIVESKKFDINNIKMLVVKFVVDELINVFLNYEG